MAHEVNAGVLLVTEQVGSRGVQRGSHRRRQVVVRRLPILLVAEPQRLVRGKPVTTDQLADGGARPPPRPGREPGAPPPRGTRGAGGRGAASHAHWLSARGVVDREVGVDTLVPPDACPIGGTMTDTSALSCSQTDTTVEPAVAGDPADPSHLVIAYQEGRRFSGGA